MLEGIADYDPARRFGIPDTDMAIMKMEADQYNRPDYYSALFEPDGVLRERLRLQRAFGVVREHPLWFGSVMARRAGSMLRLERARLISAAPALSHQFKVEQLSPGWTGTSTAFFSQAVEKAPQAQITLSADSQFVRILTDKSKSGIQFKSPPVPTQENHDYVLRVPVQVEQGRTTISVLGQPSGSTYVSTVVDHAEVKQGEALLPSAWNPTETGRFPHSANGFLWC